MIERATHSWCLSAIPNGDDILATLEEQVRHAERLIEIATAVPAQIEHERASALPGELTQRRFDLATRCLVELLHRDVANLVVEHHGKRNGRDVNDGARELRLDRLTNAAARKGDLHARTRGSR